MRHEPYKAYEGEAFTTSRKGVYSVHQRVHGVIKQLTTETFDCQDDARTWVVERAELLKIPGHRLLVTHDADD